MNSGAPTAPTIGARGRLQIAWFARASKQRGAVAALPEQCPPLPPVALAADGSSRLRGGARVLCRPGMRTPARWDGASAQDQSRYPGSHPH